MAWDIALSEHGDLVIAGNRDLAGISGSDLIEQRMKLRMKITRGSWIYDDEGSLGSNLNAVINMPPERMQTAAVGYVKEALRPMDEINVKQVQIETGTHDIIVHVYYEITGDDEEEPEIHELQASVALTPTPGAAGTTEE